MKPNYGRYGPLIHVLLAVLLLPACYLASCQATENRDDCHGTDDYCDCRQEFYDCKRVEPDLEGYSTDDYCWELEDPTAYDASCYDEAANWFFKCVQVADCRRSRMLDCQEQLSDRLWTCALVEQTENKSEFIDGEFEDDEGLDGVFLDADFGDQRDFESDEFTDDSTDDFADDFADPADAPFFDEGGAS